MVKSQAKSPQNTWGSPVWITSMPKKPMKRGCVENIKDIISSHQPTPQATPSSPPCLLISRYNIYLRPIHRHGKVSLVPRGHRHLWIAKHREFGEPCRRNWIQLVIVLGGDDEEVGGGGFWRGGPLMAGYTMVFFSLSRQSINKPLTLPLQPKPVLESTVYIKAQVTQLAFIDDHFTAFFLPRQRRCPPKRAGAVSIGHWPSTATWLREPQLPNHKA